MSGPAATRYREVVGDIVNAIEPVIAHQCNCITTKGKGLSAQLFEQFPWSNVYAARIQAGRCKRDQPGTIAARIGRPGSKCVVALFAQRYPGLSKYGNDSKAMREDWFREALLQLSAYCREHGYASVAMPHNIGCGLAGGDWSRYEEILQEWIRRDGSLSLVLYRQDGSALAGRKHALD